MEIEHTELLEAIHQDQLWHIENKDKHAGVTKDFKNGFLQGMTQANHLIHAMAGGDYIQKESIFRDLFVRVVAPLAPHKPEHIKEIGLYLKSLDDDVEKSVGESAILLSRAVAFLHLFNMEQPPPTVTP